MVPEARKPLWDAFTYCAKTNPAALRFIVLLMGLYLHVGPFSRRVMADIDRQILEAEFAAPHRQTTAGMERRAASAVGSLSPL